MKKARALKIWSKHNVPDDLWQQIFTRLPVKSLGRFRCVSKSWQDLINHPELPSLHLSTFRNNRHESHLFAAQGRRGIECVVKSSKTLRTTAKLGLLRDEDLGAHFIVSSIDGLFMLMKMIHLCAPEMVLWNPSTGSTKLARVVPPCPVIFYGTEIFKFGLGFDPLVKDYKYVTFVLERKRLRFISIYSVGTNSWKTIECQSSEEEFIFSSPRKSYCLRGVLYALAIDETVSCYQLVSFDLKSEVFASAKLPPNEGIMVSRTHWYYRCQALTLVDGGCSLAMVDLARPKGSLWVSECIGDDINSFIWTKRHTICTVFPEYDPITEPVNFLYMRKGDEDELLLRAQNVVMSYNLKTHQRKVVLKKNLVQGNIWPYIENFILLPSNGG